MFSQLFTVLIICVFSLTVIRGRRFISYGPDIKATMGQVWPKPLWQENKGHYFSVDPNNFQLVAVNENCDILQEAIQRYAAIIKASAQGYVQAPLTKVVEQIRQIQVNLTNTCEVLPHLNMDESYFIWDDVSIMANSVWGILRGLETLSQLLVPMPNGLLRMPRTVIFDKPRFKYRGLMLDSACHFISKRKILQLLEGMAYNKLNVFHWHITDDSAFPFKSAIFPELAEKGAYRPDMTYSIDDVKEIVEFARKRGIRVIPEIDTPDHTASWGASHPEIITKCYNNFEGQWGPLNPTKERTYKFLQKLFKEIRSIFKDEYIHLGGDEVDTACWESNPQIQRYLAAQGLESTDLPYIYLQRFCGYIEKLGWKQMVWQESMEDNFWMEWAPGVIAQVVFDYEQTARTLTASNYDIIRSQNWYLHVIETGGDWEKFYVIEPTDFNGTDEQFEHVLGGEACLWTEFINEHNVLSTTFPRVSAVAERLWSDKAQLDIEEATQRIEEHNCRMICRGIEARPANSYGLC